MRMLKEPASLCVVAGDLQPQSMALAHYDVGRPHFDINRVNFSGNDRLDIGRVVVSKREVRAVSGVRAVELAKRDSKPALDHWDGLTGGSCVEDWVFRNC